MTTYARKILGSVLLALAAASLTATGASATCAWPVDGSTVIFQTNRGGFFVELYPSVAPLTVAKFLEFAAEGRYDGTIFHGAFTEGIELNPFEVDTATFTHDGLNFAPIVFPSTTIPNEACLAHERGSLVSLSFQTFDGPFGFYSSDPTWGNAFDDSYTVFGRIVDFAGAPIGPAESLGPIEIVGDSVPIDGHLTLDSPYRNALRRLPFDIDRESTLDDQLDLSDLSRCFVDQGSGPTTTLAALVDDTINSNPDDPSQVLYESGIDQGEMVITTTVLNAGCGALLDEVTPIEEVTEPVNFSCPHPDFESNETWRYQRGNRCAFDDFFFWDSRDFDDWIECFIFQVDGGVPTEVLTAPQSCVGLAVAEAILDERRAEITTHVPDRIFQILSVPEPGRGLLALVGLAGLAGLARLKRTRKSPTL